MKRFRVLVAVPSGGHNARMFLGGVAKYASTRDDWDTRFILGREDDPPENELARERFDGAIVAMRGKEDAFVASGAPVIHFWPGPAAATDYAGEMPPRLPDDPRHRIVADEVRTGILAASYFLERGFRHFAFAGGLQSGVWSDVREASFVAALDKAGYPCDVYPYGGRNAPRLFTHASREDTQTCKWLKALPKPVAVFTAYDRRGEQILRCCRQIGLAVPQEVAVLGMDNDETICWSSSPPLSSIAQNLDEVGARAAHGLDRLMRGWKPQGGILILRTMASHVITRASTDIRLDNGSVLVERARALMADAATPLPTVTELAKRLRVSERLLRLRFRQCLGKSPHEALAEMRLDRAKRLVAETTATLSEIAVECGYADASHMSKAFSAAIGKSPLAFRLAGGNAR